MKKYMGIKNTAQDSSCKVLLTSLFIEESFNFH